MMQTVVIYGISLVLSTVGASLSALPELEIQRVEAQAESDLEQARAAKPDIIVVELGTASRNLTFTLLQKFPTVTLIGLDPKSDRMQVLSVQQQTALAAADLVNVILAIHPKIKE